MMSLIRVTSRNDMPFYAITSAFGTCISKCNTYYNFLYNFDKYKCILWVLECVAMKHTLSPSNGYCADMICVYREATEWTCVCSVCTEQTVLLVPLILLGIVNVLVDTSAQKEVTKSPERGQIEPSKLLSQHFSCSNNCMSMDGQDVSMGGQYGDRFKRR